MKKIIRFIAPYKWGAIGTIVLVFLQCLTDLMLPSIMSGIVDTGIVQGDTRYILMQGGLMLLIALAGAGCAIGAGYLSSKVSTAVGRDLREAVFTKAESFSLGEFDRFGTASLITRTTNDINQVQMVVLMALRMFVMSPVLLIGGLIMALNTKAELTWILAAVCPFIILGVVFLMRKATPIFKSMQSKLDRLNMVVREGQIGVRVIRAFNRTPFQNQRFDDVNDDLTNTSIYANRLMGLGQPLMMFVLNFATIMIIWFSGRLINQGAMQVGSMMAFIQYASQILFSLLFVAMIFVMLPRAEASAERINEVLDTDPAIRDDGHAKPNAGMRGQISFEDVSFHFANAQMPALSHINFTTRPGQVTAVIGGTGSGKTTLLNIIPRLYDVTEGVVRMNGVDVRDIPQKELRDRTAYVPQKAVLFTGTVADNVRYGNEDISQEEITQVLETAQATDFVSQMEFGENAILAQGGINLSGGQKQRLAIARALARKPEVYLFDDSFSALDFRTDAKLRAALKSQIGDAAMIIVAQRISTIMDADQILVLDEGRQVGLGVHRELLQNCQVYREIAESQLSKEELA